MNVRTIHRIAIVLKKTRLISFVNWIYYVKNLIRNRKVNRDFISTHGDFAVPPSHLAFDAYNQVHWQSYFDTGVINAKAIADILNKENMANNIRILEWGCGPGRVIRHLKSFLRYGSVELYGTDYNDESITWCRNNIYGIKFFINQTQPPFMSEIISLDCVYAISVFTHLSEAMHFEWIKEIRRVLKLNGLVIMTTHGDSTRDRLLSHEMQLYDLGKIVVRGNVKEGVKWYLAYHPPAFIRDKLLEGFDILFHGQTVDCQDIWVARKK